MDGQVIRYDFKAARRRVEELKMIYRQNKHLQKEDGTWDWWLLAQIEGLEKEIQEAHKNRMTAVRGSGHHVKLLKNLISPIVPQWDSQGKEESIHA